MVLFSAGTIVLAGAGKMGSAMLTGWLERGLDPRLLVVQDPNLLPDMAEALRAKGIRVDAAVQNLAAPPAVIVVAVKPQAVADVVPGLATLVGSETVVLSIAAGKTLASLERFFPKGTAVVRAMPNTPAAIGRGISGVVANTATTAAQKDLCQRLLSAAGEVVWVGDEALIDAVTAVSGSGPAYVFLLAECLAEAGRVAGLAPDLAMKLARATVSGSGELLHRSELDAQKLRKNVTSPGGTTAAALGVLMRDKSGLQDLMTEAVLAAVKRGRELGQ
jgi:pyrroline-5-carboxylate reductase